MGEEGGEKNKEEGRGIGKPMCSRVGPLLNETKCHLVSFSL